jgi:mediator of RNA polymerase II transcription subunit 7
MGILHLLKLELPPKFISDFKKELTSLNRDLQLHILELTDVLIERPSQYARRVEDISLILRNMHHLLNSMRPHQVLN